MGRISVYSISLLLILTGSLNKVLAQDTILIPLKIKVGLEVSGPVIYMIQKKNLSIEGYISKDINEKASATINAGYLDYNYSQYNYSYLNKGAFVRAGVDFNLLKPDKAMGKYWVGVGLRYGLSRFTSEYPAYYKENYWGKASSSVAKQTDWGHFVEVTPGVRTEVLGNLSIGWTISLRLLLYTSAGKELRPMYFPGFGNGGKTVSAGLNYFIVWSIPFKKINVIIKKEVPDETEDTGTGQPAGFRQQPAGIRP